MNKLTVAVSALVAAAGALAATPGVAAATATLPGTRPDTGSAAPVRWGPCKAQSLARAHAQCGMLTVPMDYAHPSGAKVRLAVSRVRHTVPASRFQGVMLVNPGGPGGSGLGFAVLGGFVPKGAGNAYDWIGFDPRGVGASRPALSCNPTYAAGPRPPYEPSAAHGVVTSWLARTQGYARACARSAGALLRHVRTTDTVRDMDSLRRALGASRISFYGYSYGTYLGQVYATTYPGRVRRMVLDSNVDPRRVWYQGNLDQDRAFEVALTKWWAWIARYSSTYRLGSTERAVESLWYEAKHKLQFSPAGGAVGAAEWNDIFETAGYVQTSWPDLARLFSGWVHTPDPRALENAYNSAASVGDDNGYAVYLAVQCTDAPWPRDWATWQRDNAHLARTAPYLTWGNAWFNAPCRVWPAPASSPVRVNGSRTPPVLLVDETLDAATPFAGSLTVRRLFPRASLIALPGGTNHAHSLAGNACLDNKIAAYLATGALPPRRPGNGPDATCAPLPPPVPSGRGAGPSPGGSPTPPLVSPRFASLLR